MATIANKDMLPHRWHITVGGTVQGVGFRPFIYQLAAAHSLSGWVCNTGDGVLIEVEGLPATLPLFFDEITTKAPPLARIADTSHAEIPPQQETTFRIIESSGRSQSKAGIPPDIATCADCRADISDPANRRYRYPFTNCTNCGPRFTIIRELPYDRPLTTMRDFVMCPACQAEYENPMNRRFHAQPNACPVCGPHLQWDGLPAVADDAWAISQTVAALRAGAVIALKGLGGYHLACDASNTTAVATLRERKGRAGKPFAVMCPDLEAARQLCDIDADAERLLLSPEHPILLLPKNAGYYLAEQVAPGLNTLGVMLPYTPLHTILLTEFAGTLVMTSGNLSEEPIAYEDADARERLGHLADHFLTHNRPIHLACDDSVARVHHGQAMLIRRARGYVPQSITIAEDELPQVLACGGDMKNTFCLTRGHTALLSQHQGDLENPVTLAHFEHVLQHFCAFYDVKPLIIAHDLHPDYHSTRLALAQGTGPKIAVQHHHAHIVGCMAEYRLTNSVIGVAFDGTGYGTDGTIWGGEILVANAVDFRRVAHLRPVALPGGEAAIKRPWRIALAYLLNSGMELPEASAAILGLPDMEATIIQTQIARGINAPLTSSMGRLFDAVSALLGICTEVSYEGQAAIELEIAALETGQSRVYSYNLENKVDGTLIMDIIPLIKGLLADRECVSKASLALGFHRTIAEMTAAVCVQQRDTTGINQVALSGGVFQNMLLLELLRQRLIELGFEVYYPSLIPCNDGGVSLGQAMIAARRYQQSCV